jgi:uncharacterized membrane protein YfcA
LADEADTGPDDRTLALSRPHRRALLTGFIDAIAGGGGLIMMPALLVSGVPPLQALGTNKLQSMFGTFVAMRNYGAKGLIEWRRNLPTALVVFAGAAAARCWCSMSSRERWR